MDILYIIRKGSAIGILKTNVQCGIGPQLQIQHLVWILNEYAGYTCDHQGYYLTLNVQFILHLQVDQPVIMKNRPDLYHTVLIDVYIIYIVETIFYIIFQNLSLPNYRKFVVTVGRQ